MTTFPHSLRRFSMLAVMVLLLGLIGVPGVRAEEQPSSVSIDKAVSRAEVGPGDEFQYTSRCPAPG